MRGGNIQKAGFTIVELLIVVVVIAILAAITIISYNGIQQRAKESQYVSALNSYSKATRAYYIANNNTLPSSATACYDGTACWSGVTAIQSEALRTELRKVMTNLPTFPSSEYIALLANGVVGSYTGPYMLFQYPGTQDCFSISGARVLNTTVSGGVRTCRVALDM